MADRSPTYKTVGCESSVTTWWTGRANTLEGPIPPHFPLKWLPRTGRIQLQELGSQLLRPERLSLLEADGQGRLSEEHLEEGVLGCKHMPKLSDFCVVL